MINKANQRILLIMDGHSTHSVQTAANICNLNSIDVCLMPPHTTHVLQPLDVGIFNSYKAAYRKAIKSPALIDVTFTGLSEATSNRIKMMAKALIANTHACSSGNIRRSFWKTGIYPVSFSRFLHSSHCCSDVPLLLKQALTRSIQQSDLARNQRVVAKHRKRVRGDMLMVSSSVEV